MRGSRFAIAYELSPMARTVSTRAAVGVVGVGLVLASAGCGGGSSGTSQATTTAAPAHARIGARQHQPHEPGVAAGPPAAAPLHLRRHRTTRRRCAGPACPPGRRSSHSCSRTQNARGESGAPFVHWSLFGIPPSATQVPTGGRDGHQRLPPADATAARARPDNDPAHRYVFTLYALRAPLDLPDGAPPTDAARRRSAARRAWHRAAASPTRRGAGYAARAQAAAPGSGPPEPLLVEALEVGHEVVDRPDSRAATASTSSSVRQPGQKYSRRCSSAGSPCIFSG